MGLWDDAKSGLRASAERREAELDNNARQAHADQAAISEFADAMARLRIPARALYSWYSARTGFLKGMANGKEHELRRGGLHVMGWVVHNPLQQDSEQHTVEMFGKTTKVHVVPNGLIVSHDRQLYRFRANAGSQPTELTPLSLPYVPLWNDGSPGPSLVDELRGGIAGAMQKLGHAP